MKVFISSTAKDLAAHRKVADDTILRLSLSCDAMERFGPLPGEPVAECERKAKESDLIICFVAHCYGDEPEKGKGSFTRREVEAAWSAGKPVLVWLVADEYAWPGIKEQDALKNPEVRADSARVAQVCEAVAALDNFKAWLRKKFVVEEFTTPEDLGRKIAVALAKHIQKDGLDTAVRGEREKRLKTLFISNEEFINDRLGSFVGRCRELRDIGRLIDETKLLGGYVTITGQAGQGKSSIIAKLLELHGRANVPYHFIPFCPGSDYQVVLLLNLIARLVLKYDLSEFYVSCVNRQTLGVYLEKVLTEVSNRGGQEIIFIDGIDQIPPDLSGERDLSFLPLSLPAGIVCVLSTRPDDTLKPLRLIRVQKEYPLPEITFEDFGLMLAHHRVNMPAEVARQLHRVLGGNALYLNLAASELESRGAEYSHIIEELTEDPNNIFSLTFERFRRNARLWQVVLKPILAMLVAAQAPFSAACIRKVTGIDSDSVLQGLEALGGLIVRDEEGKYQLYHLKLKAFLKSENGRGVRSVFDAEELQEWHLRLKKWCDNGLKDISIIWTDSNDVFEQTRRLYARQHYATHLFEAKEWASLWKILDNVQYGKLKMMNDPSTRGFAKDLILGCDALVLCDTATRREHLPRLWRYTLLLASLASRTRFYPPELFSLLALTGRDREALELLELLQTPREKALALCRISEVFIFDGGRRDEAIILFERALELAKLVENKWDRSAVSHEIIKTLAGAGEYQHAIDFAYELGDSKERVEALTGVAETLAAAGEIDHCRRLICDVKKLSLNIGYRHEAEKALEILLAGEKADVAQLFNMMGGRTLLEERKLQSRLLAKILVGFNRFEEATLVTNQLQKDALVKADVLLAIAKKLAKTSRGAAITKVDEVQWQMAINTTAVEGSLATSMSMILALVGERQRATELLEKYSKTPYIFKDLEERSTTLISSAFDQADLGNSEGSSLLMTEATKIARGIEDRAARRVALKKAADATARLGDEVLAARLYMESGTPPVPAMADIDVAISILKEQGKMRDAIELMTDQRYLERLVEHEKWEEAIEFARDLGVEEKLRQEISKLKRRLKSEWATDKDKAELRSTQSKLGTLPLRRIVRTSFIIKSLAIRDISRAGDLLTECLHVLPRVEQSQDVIEAKVAICEAACELGLSQLVVSLASEVRVGVATFLTMEDKASSLYSIAACLLKISEKTLFETVVEDIIAISSALEEENHINVQRLAVKALVQSGNIKRNLSLIDRSWRAAVNRKELLKVFPLFTAPSYKNLPSILLFVESFSWVDSFFDIEAVS